MAMHCASIHRPARHWPKEQAAGALTLDFDERHRRRIRLTTDEGEDVLRDLPKAVAMAEVDGLLLHMVPVVVGDSEKCKAATDLLLTENGIYIQPINYPTVPRGTERLRITPTPWHEDALIDQLADALTDVWCQLALPLRGQPTQWRVYHAGRATDSC